MREFAETDWKLLRRLQPLAIDRFCQRALAAVQSACADAVHTNHQRYKNVFDLVTSRDQQMAEVFNDLRRSNAFYRLAAMRQHELITSDEFAGFTAETRALVGVLLGTNGPDEDAIVAAPFVEAGRSKRR